MSKQHTTVDTSLANRLPDVEKIDYIYHGTDAEHVEDILEGGLKTRRATGRSQWGEHDMESIPDHVYLIRLYAPYFGLCAIEYGEPFAIYEIDLRMLREEQLFPDEDFIVQAIAHDFIELFLPPDYNEDDSLVEQTHSVRTAIEVYTAYWRESLEMLGNISHKGTVPSDAIRRVSVVDPPDSVLLGIDPTITLENALLAGYRYEMYTTLMMGDVTLDGYMEAMGFPEDRRGEIEEEVFGEKWWDVRVNAERE